MKKFLLITILGLILTSCGNPTPAPVSGGTGPADTTLDVPDLDTPITSIDTPVRVAEPKFK